MRLNSSTTSSSSSLHNKFMQSDSLLNISNIFGGNLSSGDLKQKSCQYTCRICDRTFYDRYPRKCTRDINCDSYNFCSLSCLVVHTAAHDPR
jgi:hypothetical protein